MARDDYRLWNLVGGLRHQSRASTRPIRATMSGFPVVRQSAGQSQLRSGDYGLDHERAGTAGAPNATPFHGAAYFVPGTVATGVAEQTIDLDAAGHTRRAARFAEPGRGVRRPRRSNRGADRHGHDHASSSATAAARSCRKQTRVRGQCERSLGPGRRSLGDSRGHAADYLSLRVDPRRARPTTPTWTTRSCMSCPKRSARLRGQRPHQRRAGQCRSSPGPDLSRFVHRLAARRGQDDPLGIVRQQREFAGADRPAAGWSPRSAIRDDDRRLDSGRRRVHLDSGNSGVNFDTPGLRIQISLSNDPSRSTGGRSRSRFPTTYSTFFVDDASNANDEYTPARPARIAIPASEPDSPKPHPVNLLRAYDIPAGAIVSIDTRRLSAVRCPADFRLAEPGPGSGRGLYAARADRSGQGRGAELDLSRRPSAGAGRDQRRRLHDAGESERHRLAARLVGYEHERQLRWRASSPPGISRWNAIDITINNPATDFVGFVAENAGDTVSSSCGPFASLTDGSATNNFDAGHLDQWSRKCPRSRRWTSLEIAGGSTSPTRSPERERFVGNEDLSLRRGNNVPTTKPESSRMARFWSPEIRSARHKASIFSTGNSGGAAYGSGDAMSYSTIGAAFRPAAPCRFARTVSTAIWYWDSPADFNTAILSNVVYGNRLGIVATASSCADRNNLIYDNSTIGLKLSEGSPDIVNNTIYPDTPERVFASRRTHSPSNCEITLYGPPIAWAQHQNDSQLGLASDFNLLYATEPASSANGWVRTSRRCRQWQSATGRDANSLTDLSVRGSRRGGQYFGLRARRARRRDDDFHLQSPFGSLHGGSLAPVRSLVSDGPAGISRRIAHQ